MTYSIPTAYDIVISDEDHTVEMMVPFGTDVTALTPTFTVSGGATASPESGVEDDFTSEVAVTVTSWDNKTTQDWKVMVRIAPASTENDILTFALAEETGTAVIDNTAKTVTIEVASGTNLETLTPTITISDNAMIVPDSGVEVDFETSPVAYTVTSESGIAQVWNVTVTKADK